MNTSRMEMYCMWHLFCRAGQGSSSRTRDWYQGSQPKGWVLLLVREQNQPLKLVGAHIKDCRIQIYIFWIRKVIGFPVIWEERQNCFSSKVPWLWSLENCGSSTPIKIHCREMNQDVIFKKWVGFVVPFKGMVEQTDREKIQTMYCT